MNIGGVEYVKKHERDEDIGRFTANARIEKEQLHAFYEGELATLRAELDRVILELEARANGERLWCEHAEALNSRLIQCKKTFEPAAKFVMPDYHEDIIIDDRVRANRDVAPQQPDKTNRVFVAAGSHGCAIRESIPCDTITWTENTISKLFKSASDAIAEKDIHNEIVNKIDPSNEFTLKLVYSCEINNIHNELDVKTLKYCGIPKSAHKIHQLVYVDGGMDLLFAAEKFPFETIFVSLESAFLGLCALQTHGFLHLDIKPENIVYNSKTRKLALIDFGMACYASGVKSTKAAKVKNFDDEKRSKRYSHTYLYYPGEFNVFDPAARKSNRWTLYACVMRNFDLADDGDNAHIKYIREQLMQFKVMEPLTYVRPGGGNAYDPKTVDVYGLGASIIEVLSISYLNKKARIDETSSRFYNAVVDLCMKMLHCDPRVRILPVSALDEYRGIITDFKGVL